MLDRRNFITASLSLLFAGSLANRTEAAPLAEPWADRLLRAAEQQLGVTLHYDPAYTRLAYPNGDVPLERGVCTDVVIRAYRQAAGLDLQQLVHEDMKKAFAQYPKNWGLKKPDPHIDHRRVPNLMVFLRRQGAALAVSQSAADYRPGDLVTQMLPGNLPHIAIVMDRHSTDRERPLVIHNIGAGTQIADSLLQFPITGHFRFAA